MRELASRMPAQKAADSPTGPAPMTVMSRTSSKSGWVMARAGSRAVAGTGSPSTALRARSTEVRDAGEARRVAQGEGRGLRRAQALDEVQEGAHVVGVEGDHELLVVEAEGVGGVVVDLRILAPDADVVLHDPPALVGGQRVPGARLDERIDEQVAPAEGTGDQALVVGVLRALAHAQERIGLRAPLRQPGLRQDDVELVDAIEVLGLGDEHDLGVAAGAHEAEGLQQMIGREVLAGGEELLLVAPARIGVQAAPGRIDLQEGVLHKVAFGHFTKDSGGQ